VSWLPEVRDVAAVAVVLLAVLILVWCWRRGDFEIRYRDGRVAFRGKVPQPHAAAVADFLAQEMGLTGPVTITGRRVGRRLQLWFSGSLSKAQRQRLRNFFLNPL